MEIRADGTLINPRGQTATWSAAGSPPTVTLNVPGRTIRGLIVQTSEGVQIVRAGSPDALTLYRCSSAQAAVAGAGNEPAASPPATDTSAAGEPRQIGGSISEADYPAAAIRANASGTTRVRLQISGTGQVVGCSVTASSGNSALDSTTCSLMQRRFRFNPAMRQGRPVASVVERSMTWQLPR
jgi:protein TonB